MTVQRTILSFIFINLLLCSSVFSLQAAEVGFSWLPNNETDLSGYKIYYGNGCRNYTVAVDVGLPALVNGRVQVEIDGLQGGQTYYFAAIAYNAAGESAYSTEIKYLVPLVSGDDPIDCGGDPIGNLSELNFNDLGLVTYSNQGGSGTVSIEDNGATFHIDGNNWVRTEEIDTITADTVIEFDFMSTVEGEIHGIGFDEDDDLHNDRRIFQLFGSWTFSSGIQVNPQYTSSDLGTWVHYSIPVGQYYTGSNMHLVIVNDHDGSPANGNGRFRNVIITEDANANSPPSSNNSSDTDSSVCAPVDPRFATTTLSAGMKYYTDRNYTLTRVPSQYVGMEAILTPNEDRNLTEASNYTTFLMPYEGTVYVAFDSRATSLPDWMTGFFDTGVNLQTSLSTQPALKVYSKLFSAGDCINLGTNKAPGFTGYITSNYLVFIGGSGSLTCKPLDSSFDENILSNSMEYYTDRGYILTDVPALYAGMNAILMPNDDRNLNEGSNYQTFTMPYNGTVYVAFDSRATSLPGWMTGFSITGNRLLTSLSTQPELTIYSKYYYAGDCINFGGPKAFGFSGNIISGYVVFYE